MKNFTIFTDSSCDLNNGIIDKLDIKVLGLSCNFKNKEYVEEGDFGLAYSEFYNSLRNEKTLPTTSQVNAFKFEKAFEEELKKGNDILYIAFSSALSGTYNSSLIAKKELLEKYPEARIEIIDVKCASTGTGVLAITAANLKKAGKSIDETLNEVAMLAPNLMHILSVSSLDHLKRGGRISATTAFVGGLLNVKPIIYVNENGELITFSKVKGNKKLLKTLAQYVDDNAINPEDQLLYISHADCLEDALALKNLILETTKFKDVIFNHIGLVIGSHTGPDALALFFFGNGRVPK
ncbi:MAG: DegV family protein [Sarcina sp.]